MACVELDSFLTKFKSLQFAGIEATLTVESKNGEAFVTLKAGLGYLQPPPDGFPPPRGYHGHGRHQRVHRGPAYFRRQERRKAAKDQVEAAVQNDVTSPAVEVGDIGVSEETQEVNDVAEEATDEICEEAEKLAEKAPIEQFECCVCDFVSNWEHGVMVHMARKHSKIEQVDGVADGGDIDTDEPYNGSKHYWAKGYLGCAYQSFLDANETLDKCDIPEEDKKTVKIKVLEARKTALGKNFEDFPPWSKR